MSLNEKTALVTGSSRGITLALAEMGARVAVHYYQNKADATETLPKIRAHGSDGFIIKE